MAEIQSNQTCCIFVFVKLFIFFFFFRFLTIMQWQWWLGESPIHSAYLTQQVTWMSLKVSRSSVICVTLKYILKMPLFHFLIVVVYRSGGLRQAASSQLSTDRCVPCMFLRRLTFIIWKRQREGQFINHLVTKEETVSQMLVGQTCRLRVIVIIE